MIIKPASLRSDFCPDTPEWLSGMLRNLCPACAGIAVRNHRNMQTLLTMLGMYTYGFLTAEYGLKPYYKIFALSEAVVNKYALNLAQLIFSEKCQKYPFVWFPTKESRPGVSIYKPDKTYTGYTFFQTTPHLPI